MAVTAIARITGVPDRLELAGAAAQVVLSDQSVSPQHAMYAKAGLALLALQTGDQSASEEHYSFFLGQRGTVIATLLSGDRLLGLLSQTIGNMVQAAAHFEDALTFCTKAGYRPELAWTCCDYADALAQRGGSDDHQKGNALLEHALSIAQELGMRPLSERVANRLGLLVVPTPPTSAYPDGLTRREVEVLGLIALGKINREIAEDLVISVGTVANHVARILAKTGAANRTEAAAYAARQNLVSW